MHPVRDWLVGLLCFFTVIVVGGAYSAHQFITFRNLDMYEKALNEQTVKYNEVLVDRVLKEYEHRETQYNALHQRQPEEEVLEVESLESSDSSADPAVPSAEQSSEEVVAQPVLES